MVRRWLCLKKRHTKSSWFEDLDDLLHDLCSLATGLLGRDVRLKGGVRAMWLRRNVDRKVVCRGLRIFAVFVGLGGGYDTIGREATGREEVRIDAGIRVLASRINI